MFYLNKQAELTVELLGKMINEFNVVVKPRLKKNKDYYDGKQAIINKSYKDTSKPCSKTVINYCRNITDSYCGYLATPDFISYKSEEDISEILDILKYNDYQTEDNSLLLDALIYGVSAELMFLDKEGKTRFRLINPLQCFPIYDDSLIGELTYFVRIYKNNEWDNSDLYSVDVYSDYDIKHYTMTGDNGNLTFVDNEPHYFSQCPANVLVMPNEESIFNCIVGLQDAMNELLSSEIDDYSAFCDAYLSLVGVDAEPEDVASMKENRVLLLPEGASATWLTKNANDGQVENILKRIHDSIYRIAQCPDFNSENFAGGVSSGVAIRYKLCGIEVRASKICAMLKKALQRRIKIICGIASLKMGEDKYTDIEINFQRNIPEDINATVNLINTLKGTVSDATLIAQLPFISDVNTELEAVSKQKQENMDMYGLGFQSHEDNEEESE